MTQSAASDTAEASGEPRDQQRPRAAPIARVVLLAFLGLAILAWIGIAVAANQQTPGIVGLATGVFGGLFAALLIAVVGAWIAMKLAFPAAPDIAPALASVGDVDPQLLSLLSEVEAQRLDTLRQIKERAAWRVPLCAAAGVGIWILGQFTGDPGDAFDFLAMLIVPGIMGYVWAALELGDRYGKLYKERVLPKLAAQFGDITWRPAVMPELQPLYDERIFRTKGQAEADDELTGLYRNLPISIVELKIEQKAGKSRILVFDGLLMQLDLPRDTNAVTTVTSDAGAIGNFSDRLADSGRERVRLEDPVFEKIYEVYGTDQVAARALLHPAFMEKLLALGEMPDFERPLVLCVGRKLIFAMPKRGARNLFEAPSYRKPAASLDALVTLKKDIAAVLSAADAVIDLDHRFEVMARH